MEAAVFLHRESSTQTHLRQARQKSSLHAVSANKNRLEHVRIDYPSLTSTEPTMIEANKIIGRKLSLTSIDEKVRLDAMQKHKLAVLVKFYLV